ncbi:MAG TPA: CoA transferase [Eoetvoesiella sp.]
MAEKNIATKIGPLQGLRIIDLSTVVLGPYASQFLAEYGAEVIKIEALEGDSTRRIGPQTESGMASLFMSVNRNKRSVAIDLKQREGRETLLALIGTADVFMHNMRPQKIAKLGLDPTTLTALNPRLIYAGLHGFSENGLYAGRPAYDDIIQGLCGMAALMEMQSGIPGYLPTVLADKVASLIGVQAILAAVVERARTNKGVVVEVPMFESLVSFGLVEHLYGGQFDPPQDQVGYMRVLMPYRRPYATLDSYLCIMPYSDEHWHTFLSAVNDSEALKDPRFASLSLRTKNIDALYQRLSEHVRTRTTNDWLRLCQDLDIPAAPMNRLEDLQNDPHLMSVGHFQKVHDPQMGTLVFPANPVRFNDWQPTAQVPPRLGADTVEVLRENGFDDEQIAVLVSLNVITRELVSV